MLINGYIKNSSTSLSYLLKQVLKELDSSEQDELIFDLTDELSERNITIDSESQKLLFYKTREIRSQIDKSVTLVNLASIWTNESVTSIKKILSEASKSWEDEDDLKRKIIVGFHLVEKIAPLDKEFAHKFCEDVQSTLLYPGAELATGGLGMVYVSSIDLAIRSLGTYNVKDNETLEKIFDQIDKLPSTYLRHQLYAQIAAKIYSLGVFSEAEEVVQDKILNQLSEITNKDIREKIIQFSLPVLFWYSQEIAKELSKEISDSIINRAWFRVILWSLSKGQLGDLSNYEIIKAATNSATIRDKAIVALRHIKEDVEISLSVDIITQSIEHSVRKNSLDPKSAFDILFEIEGFVEKSLPDKNNIKHNGYRIVSLARINGARSNIYKDIKRKGQFSKVDIKSKWGEIETMAKGEIGNIADRIFVVTRVAKEMRAWDADKAEILLESISNEIKKIPSILDRSDRLEHVAETWGIWGQKRQSEFFYSQIIELLSELSPWNQDKKLEHIVQAAYQISPDLADELVERIDSRFPDRVFKPFQLRLKSLIYAHDIGKLINESESDQSRLQGVVIQSSTNKMLNDLLTQNGTLPPREKLLEVVYRSSFYDSEVVNDVLKWALECENQQQRRYKTNLFNIFIKTSEYTHELAKWISPFAQKGISQDVHSFLPGLSSKVVVFQPGQRSRAENWVKNWITNKAEGYIKICDPYFGPQELAFLSDIRRGIKILIITTDEKFENKEDPKKIQQELLQAWRRVGKGNVPLMTFLIVPAKLENTFHDRAIVTNNSGLDIGPSLNGLGNEMQRITELEYNEAKELEVKYIDDMLNQGKWFINHSVHPEYIIIS